MKKSTTYGFLWAAWLGWWVGALGVHIYEIKFWIIFMPIVILVGLEADSRVEEEKDDR